MKVIISVVNSDDKKETIAKGFHNTDFSCIYDLKNNFYQWVTTITNQLQPFPVLTSRESSSFSSSSSCSSCSSTCN